MNDYFRKQVSEPRRIILPSVYKQLEQDSLTRYPHEACGILLGEIAAGAVVIDGYVPVTNASAQPDRHFSLDPQEWVKHSYHPKLLGLFHSHPTAPRSLQRRICGSCPYLPACLNCMLSVLAAISSRQPDKLRGTIGLAFRCKGMKL